MEFRAFDFFRASSAASYSATLAEVLSIPTRSSIPDFLRYNEPHIGALRLSLTSVEIYSLLRQLQHYG